MIPSRITRTVWPALAVWLLTSAIAVAAVRIGILPALLIGAAGGFAFGLISARRVDARRVRRKRRKRRTRKQQTQPAEPDPHLHHAPSDTPGSTPHERGTDAEQAEREPPATSHAS